ncbi:hypothetical protein JoomaDRAFT_3076 [Galbibacter orientalis DSM 19592]|uniref:Uncharacterized protein n=1 Tax=Galbibacter orientalis DSM 19592 TaxID=926559 RepID=I3C8T6_9FLAO|nr:hypothetical protein JoomaDRAFT_3076 [Galbibacter orientalis DSM 19592]
MLSNTLFLWLRGENHPSFIEITKRGFFIKIINCTFAPLKINNNISYESLRNCFHS